MFHWITLSPEMSLAKDVCGYLAGGLVLCTFLVKSMARLRCLGIVSNLAFTTYAMLPRVPPILILHGILLPINIYHLTRMEIARQTSPRLNVDHTNVRSFRVLTGAFYRKQSGTPANAADRRATESNNEPFIDRYRPST
jgi:hypothetical protein